MKSFLKKHLKSLRVGISAGLVMIALFFAVRSNIFDRLAEITAELSLAVVGLAFVLAVATHVAAATRFYSIILAANRNLRWFSVFRANVLGSVFGMVIVQMIGQMAGRQTILYRYGVSPAVLSLATLIERFILAAVGGAGALAGALYLIGFDEITAISLPEVIITPILICLSLAISYTLFGSSIENRLVDLATTGKNIFHIVIASVLTCITWAITLFIFVLLILTLHPEVGMPSALAASAIISFAAAVPISVNGWGVREITAVWILGTLGIPAADALVVSVGVGLLSTVSIFILLPVVGLRKQELTQRTGAADAEAASGNATVAATPAISGFAEASVAWALGLGVACFIFFQVTIGIDGTLATVSLADLFALAAFAFLLLRVVLRQPLPDLGSPVAYPLLAAVTGAILLALAIGTVRYGPIEWAIGNRTVGWMLLLGYFGAAAIIADTGGREGVNRVIQTIVIVALLVCIAEISLKLLPVDFVQEIGYAQILAGFYENRNAHAFLALICWVLSILVFKRNEAALNQTLLIVGSAILIFFVLGSRGRAATFVLVAVFPIAALLFATVRKQIFTVGILGIVLFLLWDFFPVYSVWFTNFVQAVIQYLSGAGEYSFIASPQRTPFALSQGYDNIRWELNEAAFAMWQQFPLFGGGLGAFMESQLANPINEFGPHVVHNTLLWLLAEFGLVGTAIVGSWFGFLAWQAMVPKQGRWADWQKALFLCLLVFGAYSLVHEIFYQRIFWFATGLLLALGAHEQAAIRAAVATASGKMDQPAGPEAQPAETGADHSTTVR